MNPYTVAAYACLLLAIVSIALFGYAVWEACGIPGDDPWGERAMGALFFSAFMYSCFQGAADDAAAK